MWSTSMGPPCSLSRNISEAVMADPGSVKPGSDFAQQRQRGAGSFFLTAATQAAHSSEKELWPCCLVPVATDVDDRGAHSGRVIPGPSGEMKTRFLPHLLQGFKPGRSHERRIWLREEGSCNIVDACRPGSIGVPLKASRCVLLRCTTEPF